MERIMWVFSWISEMVLKIWTIETLFIVLVLAIIWLIVKYVPQVVSLYIKSIEKSNVAIDKAHDKFSSNLEIISTKFVWSLDKISDEHSIQNQAHIRHYEKLIDIHRDVKDLSHNTT